MKRFLGLIVALVGLVALSSVALAQWGGGPGGRWGGMGPGMMGGGGRGWTGGAPCFNPETTAGQVTEDKAKDLAQQYAEKYLAGFTVDKVLPFTGMRHTMYSVELKNTAGEVRTLHINPFGNVMPFGGPRQRRS